MLSTPPGDEVIKQPFLGGNTDKMLSLLPFVLDCSESKHRLPIMINAEFVVF